MFLATAIDSQLVQNFVFIIFVVIAAIAYSRSHVPQLTIKNLKELVDSYKIQVDVLNEKQIENVKDIADLQGQIKVYKELPLQEIATSMKDLANSNKQILKQLTSSARIAADELSK